MTEIEKMYENAGIKPVIRDNAIGRGCYIEHQRVEEYPPFTTDKQLELIKWFVTNNAELETLEITYYLNDCFQISSCTKSSHFETDFENAIAGLINNLWQDLTDAERKQIKEILE